ncbi:MAG: hypothetical protein HYS70_04545 [Nitrospinae bacterium]|nr:hypothetical protein [Nitrospinota bacterium]
MLKRLILFGLVICLLDFAVSSGVGAEQPAPPPATPAERSTAAEVGLGAGSALLTLVYGPVKIGYCLLGTITGGMAYVVTAGNREVALRIIEPAVRGTYVITPAILTGEEDWHFVGPSRAQEEKRKEVAPSKP